ncbi:hypothetical protein [Pseudomonas sp. NPDC079086]|uniref:hypothetical protein n=1 Tax=unclassified Pseudomonas TaxID=196821 RepID=UPI0037CA3A8B
MKKIIAASLFAGAFVSVGAFAAATDVQLTADAYVSVGSTSTDINLARQFNILAVDSRQGFVKNDFESTLSANVVAGALDNAANNRFGVEAGSNKGYVAFTGSSVGGSVSQCGDPVKKGTTDLAASLIDGSKMDLNEPNGCKP